jgi:ribosome-associated heat shock protein Hsp15
MASLMSKSDKGNFPEAQRQRVDKWLWAARFYKTRSLAAQAVEAGRARVNGERVKPARELKPGDEVLVRVGELEWKLEVRAMAERRGPASEAALLYAEGDDSRTRRETMIAMRRSGPQPLAHEGRPTKRDRRLLERFKRGD